MKNKILAFVLVLCTVAVSAQDTKKPAQAKPAPARPAPATRPSTVKDAPGAKPAPVKSEQVKPVNDEDVQHALQAYMTPGNYHEMLARSTGEWKESVTLWSTPGAEPVTTELSCVIHMIFDGRYQESIHTGVVNDMPFEGRGMMAYDNAAGKFYSTWIDNMSTGVMFTSGTSDIKGQRIELNGEVVDPITKKLSKIREVVHFKSDNEQVHETYTTPSGGTEYKSMEIRMFR